MPSVAVTAHVTVSAPATVWLALNCPVAVNPASSIVAPSAAPGAVLLVNGEKYTTSSAPASACASATVA